MAADPRRRRTKAATRPGRAGEAATRTTTSTAATAPTRLRRRHRRQHDRQLLSARPARPGAGHHGRPSTRAPVWSAPWPPRPPSRCRRWTTCSATPRRCSPASPVEAEPRARAAAARRRRPAAGAERQPLRPHARTWPWAPRPATPAARRSWCSRRRAGCGPRTARPWRSATTRATGRSACWCAPRPRRCASAAPCRSPAAVSDPCDGRTQGTDGMMDSLAYRNDAAIVLRRLIRSLPTGRGVMAVGTCDKGLPAMLLALAGAADLPGIAVPGGVTLPAARGRGRRHRAVHRRALRARRWSTSSTPPRWAAARAARPAAAASSSAPRRPRRWWPRRSGSTLPHAALAPSGTPVWLDLAPPLGLRRCCAWRPRAPRVGDLLTDGAVRNAMLAHAAFGGSTNLLLHLAGVAREAGLRAPDGRRLDRRQPRDAAARRRAAQRPAQPPDGARAPRRRRAGGAAAPAARSACSTSTPAPSPAAGARRRPGLVGGERRSAQAGRERLREAGVDPDDVIAPPATARARGLAPTLVFPVGNLAPRGLRGQGDLDRREPRCAATCSTTAGRPACSPRASRPCGRSRRADGDALRPGDVLVLAGAGPLGTGMAEIASITIALKLLPWGREVAVLTDGRFSGVSTGPCIGHVSPEALAGGPIGRLRDGDLVEIDVDRARLDGQRRPRRRRGPALHARARRPARWRRATSTPRSPPHPRLPDDTRLWAALQAAERRHLGRLHVRRRRDRRRARGGPRGARARGAAARRERRAWSPAPGAGIGRAVCAALAADGWDLVLNDVDAASRRARRVRARGGGRRPRAGGAGRHRRRRGRRRTGGAGPDRARRPRRGRRQRRRDDVRAVPGDVPRGARAPAGRERRGHLGDGAGRGPRDGRARRRAHRAALQRRRRSGRCRAWPPTA